MRSAWQLWRGQARTAKLCLALAALSVAAAGGQVIWSGEKGSYGNLIQIDHGNGCVTYYAHCSELQAAVGDWVAQGQTIALVGSTGRSTGPHCHFEVLWQGERLDPQNCLP